MNELSLFTGAGGGIYASLLLGWKTIGYVEYDDYCQRVIAQRIKDGIFHEAPIFGDIRGFIESGAVDQYRGVTDVVSGGFPCQPFSIAGKRGGADDERNMWPATVECIRRVQPRFCLLENVPSLLDSGYFGTILGDLAESGYSVRWRCLSGAEVGAPHFRDRLWIVAYPHSTRLQGSVKRATAGLLPLDNVPAPQCFPQSLHDLPKPILFGSGNGVAHRRSRTRAIGNGQIPLVAATAWRLLTADLDVRELSFS